MKKILIKLENAYAMRLCLLFLLFGYMQQAVAMPGSSYITKIHGRDSAGLKEKIYVQTDKTFYMAGEVCWFKAFCLDAASRKSSPLSGIVYVELLDRNNIPVLQSKLRLEGGQGAGSFYLPMSLASDNYRLRAYTRWMQNEGQESFFTSMISVGNPSLAVAGLVVEKPSYDLQFFPEGGTMLENIPVKLAFRMADARGHGISVTGVILNEQMDTLVHFATYKFGLGSCTFLPLKGGRYTALVRLPDGKLLRMKLSEVRQNGYSLSLNQDSAGNRMASVEASSLYKQSNPVLVLRSGDVIKARWTLNLKEGRASQQIDKMLLADGISVLTLYAGGMQPVAERLVFSIPAKKLVLRADSLRGQYQPRKLVHVQLHGLDELKQPDGAFLSVAVSRSDSLEAGEQESLFTVAWLRPEIRGIIEDADFYEHPELKGWSMAMENLLMVQGWRGFSNQETNPAAESRQAGGPHPAFRFPELNGEHTVLGKVTSRSTGRPAAGVLGYLSFPGTRLQFYVSKTDSAGILRFYTHDLFGPTELIAQLQPDDAALYQLEIENPFSTSYPTGKLPTLKPNYSLFHPLTRRSIAMQVQNVFHEVSLRKFARSAADTGSFYGKPDLAFKLDEYTRFTTMEEVLREFIHNTQLTIHQKKFQIRVLHPYETAFFKEDPLILYDGIPVFSTDLMVRQDPLKIRKIELVDTYFLYGPLASSGILSFSSYHGDFPGLQLDPKIQVLDYEGLQNRRVFYAPVYETSAAVNSRMPDFRTTLLWLPLLTLEKGLAGEISFYTSDLEGKYSIVIQGMSAQGRIAHEKLSFEVKN